MKMKDPLNLINRVSVTRFFCSQDFRKFRHQKDARKKNIVFRIKNNIFVHEITIFRKIIVPSTIFVRNICFLHIFRCLHIFRIAHHDLL